MPRNLRRRGACKSGLEPMVCCVLLCTAICVTSCAVPGTAGVQQEARVAGTTAPPATDTNTPPARSGSFEPQNVPGAELPQAPPPPPPPAKQPPPPAPQTPTRQPAPENVATTARVAGSGEEGVALRAAPTTAAALQGRAPDNTVLLIDCAVIGQVASDDSPPTRTSRIWVRTGSGEYVSLLYLVPNRVSVPECQPGQPDIGLPVGEVGR